MNKLLREVPTMESWISGGTSEFVQVSLHQDFIKAALDDLKRSVDNWLKEPIEFCQNIGSSRRDLKIDGLKFNYTKHCVNIPSITSLIPHFSHCSEQI